MLRFRPVIVLIAALTVISSCESPMNVDTPRKKEIIIDDDDPFTPSQAVSIALALDAGLSVLYERDAIIAGATEFVNLMDGVIDEAAIVWCNPELTRIPVQGMTSNLSTLRDALDAMPATGSSRLWDGLKEGVARTGIYGRNTTRAVIVLYDGKDDFSASTYGDVKAIADQHSIIVFSIALGKNSQGTVDDSLFNDLSSSRDGERFYLETPGDSLKTVFSDIMIRLRQFNQ